MAAYTSRFGLNRRVTDVNWVSDSKSIRFSTTPLAITNRTGVLFVLKCMSKTYTPELTPDVLRRLEDFAAHFRDAFSLDRPARWAGVYLAGLIQEGERKSIEPLSRRVALPAELQVKDPEQALQQFVNQSPWDEQQVLRRSWRGSPRRWWSSPRPRCGSPRGLRPEAALAAATGWPRARPGR